MSGAFHGAGRNRLFQALWLLWLATAIVHAQTCLSAPDMDDSARTAIQSSAQRMFQMAAKGDLAALRQNAVASAAATFGPIENAVKENQPNFTGATASVRPPYLLSAEGTEPLPRAEFLCGVFGKSGQTSNSAVFIFTSLPPGKYGVAILDVTGGKEPRVVTLVMQQVLGDWKLAGFYTRATTAGGHDSSWFAQRAREFKTKGQLRNAWLFYREALALTAPVDFMSTLATDKLYDEAQPVLPADFPASGHSVDFVANGKTYRWTEAYLLAVGDDLDLVLRYDAADTSDQPKIFAQNTQLIKAIVAKFPQLRDAFAGVVARATEPTGRDFGTLLTMKEIK